MIRMTSYDYYDFLEKVLERYETGELSEEEARQMVNDAVIDDGSQTHVNRMMYQMIIYHLVVIVNMMTIEELMNKLGLVEVSKVDKQLLEHLLHLYNTGQLKAVSISREEALLQMADAYLNNCLPQIDDIIYRD